MHKLFPEKFIGTVNYNSINDNTLQAKHREANIKEMCSLIITNKLLDKQSTNRGLLNVFTGQKANPEQANDMLSCRKTTSLESFQQYVTYHILQKPSSINAPLRRHKLLTMSSIKQSRKKLSLKDQEAKQVIKCLRRRLAWCNQTKLTYNSNEEQYSVLPRALVDEGGNPHKGNKSTWTDKLQNRYHVPEVVIIDAMFMINMKPLRRTVTIIDYSKLLFNQYALEHHKDGTNEVQLIFDKLAQYFNPKQFEHVRRSKTKTLNSNHEHIAFTYS